MVPHQRIPLVAGKDIKCYKLVSRGLFGIYRTPIIGQRILKSQINGTDPFVAVGEDSNLGNEIAGGFIHCVSGIDDPYVEWIYVLFSRKVFRRIELHECIIPSGTEYHTGSDGMIAARRVIIGKRVKTKYE